MKRNKLIDLIYNSEWNVEKLFSVKRMAQIGIQGWGKLFTKEQLTQWPEGQLISQWDEIKNG